jgi:hypothetical protein
LKLRLQINIEIDNAQSLTSRGSLPKQGSENLRLSLSSFGGEGRGEEAATKLEVHFGAWSLVFGAFFILLHITHR